MNAYKLDKMVSLQAITLITNEYGEEVGSDYVSKATVWASIRPLGSRERIIAAQANSSQSHVVTVRYHPVIAKATGSWRVQYGDRLFGLTGLPRNPDEDNRWLILDCVEQVND